MAHTNGSRLYPDLQSRPRSTGFAQFSVGGFAPQNPGVLPANMLTRENVADLKRLPLDLRFTKLQQLFLTSDIRDLQEIFPAAVEAIFGLEVVPVRASYSSLGGHWNAEQPYVPISFCEINSDYALVYNAGYQLLSSEGPVMRFLTNIIGGRSGHPVRFDFPVACLPFSAQKGMQNGALSAWYRDKVQQHMDSSMGDIMELPENISMNALEFYFAHFAYHLVDPDLRTNNPADPTCLYMALVDNYCTVFFDPSAILDNQRLHANHTALGISKRAHYGVQQGLSGKREVFDGNHTVLLEPFLPSHPLATSETLECLINIFVEFWLNMSGFNSRKYARRYQPVSRNYSNGRLSPSFGQSSLSPGNRKRQHTIQNNSTVFPPTCALQAFRQVIKALHEFIYAQVLDGGVGYRRNMEASLLDMKRHIIPQLVQRPLYDMLKNTMKKYPMDASFRYVYELWLTYLQPWRYENILSEPPTEEIIVATKDHRWSSFVTENLLFYVTLFQTFVDRMLRVDFSVPFNTLAVFRVAKVYYETRMFKIIQDIDDVVLGIRKASPPRSGLSPSKTTVKNHFADLEGPSFHYVPFGSPESVTKVTELLQLLLTAENQCQAKMDESKSTVNHDVANLQCWIDMGANFLKSAFGVLTGPVPGMRLQPAELEKMSKHTAKSTDYLSKVFEVSLDEIKLEETRAPSPGTEFLLDREPLVRPSDRVSAVSHRSSYRRHRNLSPSRFQNAALPHFVEPEAQLPKSWEISWLVPFLNTISRNINAAYGHQISDVYHGRDFRSRLLQPLIEPPHNPIRLFGDENDRPSLPARINLRPLASKYFVGSVLFAWFFFWLIGWGPFQVFSRIAVVGSFYLVAHAFLQPYLEQETERIQATG